MKGYYHSIEPFGTVDGPGIRYVLFLAGCALSCDFCHNPDTWERGNKTITVEEVLADLEKYRSFYDASGGGITVSGGEPLLQPEFVAALFQACTERGIHTTLDTAGYCPAANVAQVLPYTKLVLFGLKAVDPLVHERLTRVQPTEIISNLRSVCASVPVVVRYVVIPGVNNRRTDWEALKLLVQSLPGKVTVDLLPYHLQGKIKWECLGKEYPLPDIAAADAKDVAEGKQILTAGGILLTH